MAMFPRLTLLTYAVALAAFGCGSREDLASGADGSAESSAPSTGNGTEYAFEGQVDPEHGTMTIVTRSGTGGIVSEVNLPVGNSAGHVFFHTCSAGWDGGTHELWGNVQGANLMPTTVAVDSLTAVIDSVSAVGVTPSSGTIATYGNVAPNSEDCSSSQSWIFSDPSGTNFSFTGHATGTIACAAGKCPTQAQNGCATTNTNTDVNNCGSCGQACSATGGHYASCVGGSCQNNTCTACPGGQYASTACTSTSNTVCTACSTCGSGQYASTACTSTSDTACSPCSTCGGGQYVSSACGGMSDTTCSNCTVCANNQYMAAACGATTNTVCAACDPSCATCSGAGNNACLSCDAPLVFQ